MSRDAGSRNQREDTLKLLNIFFLAEILVKLSNAIWVFRIHHDDVQKIFISRFTQAFDILCGGIEQIFQKVVTIVRDQIESV